MTETRTVLKVVKSKPAVEGAGVHLHRVFGFAEAPEFDPFLLLDDFRSDNPRKFLPGFPWHPHRGIETITYMLNGTVEHGDSMGNRGVIAEGDVQWMTAGSGVIHQEMPKGDAGNRMGGFQLWANLPASHKMMDPRYREIKSARIPEITIENGVKARVIAGTVNGTRGPVRDIVTDPEYLDVQIAPGNEFTRNFETGRMVLAYCIEGKAVFCGAKNPFDYTVESARYFDMNHDRFIDNGSLVVFGDGEGVTVTTEEAPVRFLLISGKPVREPVAWFGPIVMNTREELRVAFDEYAHGTFIKNTDDADCDEPFGNGEGI